MGKPHNQRPEDILPELANRLISAGLQPQMIQIVEGNLALNFKKDFLTLPPEIRDQAYKVVQHDGKRQIANLVQMIVKHLEMALEMEEDPDDPQEHKPRKPPRGRKGIWKKTSLPPELQPPESDPEKEKNAPRTPKEILDYYNSYMEQNVGGLQFDDETKEMLAQRAADVMDELMDEYGLTAHEAATITKTSLYDIFFLCDDSGTMNFGNRRKTLSKTLQSVSFWATKIEPSGISLRFLNYTNDDNEQYDYLTDAKVIDERIMGVKPRGPTKLGTMLNSKVIRPLKKRAEDVLNRSEGSNGKIKPRIIIIITDGAPTDGDCLQDIITHVKTEGLGKRFGQAMTIFLLAQVGDDEDATEFIEGLVTDPEVSSMLYTLNQPLDGLRELLAKEVGDEFESAYRTLWMRLINAALNTQTK